MKIYFMLPHLYTLLYSICTSIYFFVISGTLYIYNANSSSQKDISSLFGANYGGSGSGMSNLVGSWPGTATVSSLTLQNNGTGLIGGGKSIYLYGAN